MIFFSMESISKRVGFKITPCLLIKQTSLCHVIPTFKSGIKNRIFIISYLIHYDFTIIEQTMFELRMTLS